MSQVPPTRRRWFQFGLGTMFVVVTLLAVALAWETSRIRQRQSARQRVLAAGGEVVTSEGYNKFTLVGRATATVPFWRRWLGDEAIEVIILGHGASRLRIDEAKVAFPEATKLYEYSPDRRRIIDIEQTTASTE